MRCRAWALIAALGFIGAVQAQTPPPPTPTPPPPRILPPPACAGQTASVPGRAEGNTLPSTSRLQQMLSIDASRAGQVRQIMRAHMRAQRRVDDHTCAALKKTLGETKLKQWMAQAPPPPPPLPPAPPVPPQAPSPPQSGT